MCLFTNLLYISKTDGLSGTCCVYNGENLNRSIYTPPGIYSVNTTPPTSLTVLSEQPFKFGFVMKASDTGKAFPYELPNMMFYSDSAVTVELCRLF
jgi:hypothetical protein